MAREKYQVEYSEKAEDQEWDRFLASTPESHHVQTSLWAQVQASEGWRSVRIILRQSATVVAGAQLLMRRWPLIGAIGHITHGPIIAVDDEEIKARMIESLKRAVREYRVQYLFVQPPHNATALARELYKHNFTSSYSSTVLGATLVINLYEGLDSIRAEMKSKTRYNARHGQRKGIVVREGGEEDLTIFCHLLEETGERQNFASSSQAYFRKMWRTFKSPNGIKLLLAEYDGEVISAFLYLTFGDRFIYKRGAWNGKYGKYHPNEVLHWKAIEMAKADGYHYYDFDGIERAAAEAHLRGDKLPPQLSKGVTVFKLGFGGQPWLLPESVQYIQNPIYRRLLYALGPDWVETPIVRRVVHLLTHR